MSRMNLLYLCLAIVVCFALGYGYEALAWAAAANFSPSVIDRGPSAVITPEKAAKNGGWVAWPSKTEFVDKHRPAVYIWNEYQNDADWAFRSGELELAMSEVLEHLSNTDAVTLVIRHWKVNDRGCRTVYFYSSENAPAPNQLYNTRPTAAKIELQTTAIPFATR